ncbi:DUF3325 family protein [Pseudoduganella lutea]|uniref:DUF3325 family protein n=1 Tax=Pseudoduganella lutea TaxID=321985 RepID=A0A4P6L470_9BURK|nr:DUF3325 family protein [Pseudoduganella lutea]QBE66257.1 DUF3325 family protein [Pseudoduganella lutea]
MRDGLMLLAALVACLIGMGWLALSLEAHWQQVRGTASRSAVLVRSLRCLGAAALACALALCLRVDAASIAVLVWLMGLAAAALAVALTLSWRARALGVLVFWAGR